MKILLYISTEKHAKRIYMIYHCVSQYLMCIYLLREWIWVIVLLFFYNIYIQISIIPINIMLFFPFYMKLFYMSRDRKLLTYF